MRLAIGYFHVWAIEASLRVDLSVFHLYVDDSGSRFPDKVQAARNDGMDYFALGGILVGESEIGKIIESHKSFLSKWSIVDPLHSTKIRGARGTFSWLSKDSRKSENFLNELNDFILSAPMIAISCVIDRAGYLERYAGKHQEPWLLCQTAFAILVERSAKFARDRNSQLKIFFEEAGKKEDRNILSYMKALKTVGMPFPGSAAAGDVAPLTLPPFSIQF